MYNIKSLQSSHYHLVFKTHLILTKFVLPRTLLPRFITITPILNLFDCSAGMWIILHILITLYSDLQYYTITPLYLNKQDLCCQPCCPIHSPLWGGTCVKPSLKPWNNAFYSFFSIYVVTFCRVLCAWRCHPRACPPWSYWYGSRLLVLLNHTHPQSHLGYSQNILLLWPGASLVDPVLP